MKKDKDMKNLNAMNDDDLDTVVGGIGSYNKGLGTNSDQPGLNVNQLQPGLNTNQHQGGLNTNQYQGGSGEGTQSWQTPGNFGADK